MKVLGVPFIKKTFLLPVILVFALFLVVLGMRPVSLQKLSKPRIHHRDVVQNQVKISLTSPDQIMQAFEPSCSVELVNSPTYRVSVFLNEERNSTAVTISFISSRAPPVHLV